MKQKNSSKNFSDNPMLDNSSKRTIIKFPFWYRLRSLMQRYPKATAAIMLGMVIINVVVLLVYSGGFKSVSYSFKSLQNPPLGGQGADRSDMGIPFSFENYRTMKSIQDTLSWLAAKKNRTAADTAVLLRLIDKIEKLDPLFFDKIKNATHEKNSITGNRDDTTKRNH